MKAIRSVCTNRFHNKIPAVQITLQGFFSIGILALSQSLCTLP